MECNNHSYGRLQFDFDVHNQEIQKISCPLLDRGPISRMGLMLQHQ